MDETKNESKDQPWERETKKLAMEKWQSNADSRGEWKWISRHLLRRYSPPVSVNAIFEVQHSQPPDVHVQHVVIKDILSKKQMYTFS